MSHRTTWKIIKIEIRRESRALNFAKTQSKNPAKLFNKAEK